MPEVLSHFAHFGKEIFGVEGKDAQESAELAIGALRSFFESLDVPMSFKELGIGPEHFDEMAEHAVSAEGLVYAWVPLGPKDVRKIYEMCL